MSKYASTTPARSADTSGRPRLPSDCGVSGCRQAVAVVQVIVSDERGAERSGWWSDFAKSPTTLKGGYTFVEWVPRCSDHYLRDLYAVRRGTNSPITGTSMDLTSEAVHAHWDYLDAKTAGREVTV